MSSPSCASPALPWSESGDSSAHAWRAHYPGIRVGGPGRAARDVESIDEGYRARIVASGRIDIRKFNVVRRWGPIVGRRVSLHLDIDAVFEGAAA